MCSPASQTAPSGSSLAFSLQPASPIPQSRLFPALTDPETMVLAEWLLMATPPLFIANRRRSGVPYPFQKTPSYWLSPLSLRTMDLTANRMTRSRRWLGIAFLVGEVHSENGTWRS